MSQSSTLTMQTPNPMKKKVVVALVSVLIGHVVVLWSISHMKTPELKQIEKKPIKVKFVKIVEEAPPPPVEPIKPKVTPKPEPKVEPPKPIEKPKVIAQKPQKTEDKKVIQQPDDTLEKQKLEQERLDKQRQLEQQQREQQQREQQQREQQQRTAQENTNKTRILSAGEISWVRSPKPKYTNKDLDGAKRTVTILIDADASGKITNAQITKSSGLPALDEKVLRAVRSAKFKASKDGSLMRASLPLELELNSNG